MRLSGLEAKIQELTSAWPEGLKIVGAVVLVVLGLVGEATLYVVGDKIADSVRGLGLTIGAVIICVGGVAVMMVVAARR